MAKIFPPEKPNGDGFVPAAMTENDELKLAIADVIAIMGAETDRSGEAAVSEEKLSPFSSKQMHFLHGKIKVAAMQVCCH